MTRSKKFESYDVQRSHRNTLLASLRKLDKQICEEYGLESTNWSGILRHYESGDLALIEQCVAAGVTFIDSFQNAFEREKTNRAIESMILD